MGDLLPPIELIAYQHADRHFQRQVIRISEVRTTSSFLLAATALVGSFLGSRVLDTSGVDVLSMIGLVALAVGVLCGVRPLWPIRRTKPREVDSFVVKVGLHDFLGLQYLWNGGPRVDDVLSATSSEQAPDFARLARTLELCADQNSRMLDRRQRWVMACTLSLALQVTVWCVALLAGP